MAGKDTKKSGDKLKARPRKLTTTAINREVRIFTELFKDEKDERRKKLIDDLIAETAFLKVACVQAKEEMKAEGLTIETVNASQRFTKAHPAAQIYQQYNKQYAAHLGQLIELLPEEAKEERSRLADFRRRAQG